MKKLFIILLLTLISNIIYSQTTACSGTINYSSVPTRVSTTLASAVRIGDGGNGLITVCIQSNFTHPSNKCSGTAPTLYIQFDDGSGTEAFYAIWDMRTTTAGTCYTFNTCNSYAYLKRTSCNTDNGGTTTISWYYQNYQGGSYKNRCTNTDLSLTGSNECMSYTQICDSGTYPGNASGSGVEEIGCSAPSGNSSGCLETGENNSAWYMFEVQTSGDITFTITPATNKDDYDFALWGPNPTCTNLGSPVRCNFALNKGPTGLNNTASVTSENSGCVNGAGCTNTGFSSKLAVTAGQTYILLVDGFATAIDPNYSINFGGTASILCPTSMNLLPNKPIIVVNEEDLPEPLKIIRRCNMQMQEVSEDYEGVQVVMYDNGTRDRIIKIK